MYTLKSFFIRARFRICGFESGMSCLMDEIGRFMGSRESTASGRALAFFSFVLSALEYASGLCPAVWEAEFKIVMIAVKAVVDILKLCKSTVSDVDNALSEVDRAVEVWKSRSDRCRFKEETND